MANGQYYPRCLLNMYTYFKHVLDWGGGERWWRMHRRYAWALILFTDASFSFLEHPRRPSSAASEKEKKKVQRTAPACFAKRNMCLCRFWLRQHYRNQRHTHLYFSCMYTCRKHLCQVSFLTPPNKVEGFAVASKPACAIFSALIRSKFCCASSSDFTFW